MISETTICIWEKENNDWKKEAKLKYSNARLASCQFTMINDSSIYKVSFEDDNSQLIISDNNENCCKFKSFSGRIGTSGGLMFCYSPEKKGLHMAMVMSIIWIQENIVSLLPYRPINTAQVYGLLITHKNKNRGDSFGDNKQPSNEEITPQSSFFFMTKITKISISGTNGRKIKVQQPPGDSIRSGSHPDGKLQDKDNNDSREFILKEQDTSEKDQTENGLKSTKKSTKNDLTKNLSEGVLKQKKTSSSNLQVKRNSKSNPNQTTNNVSTDSMDNNQSKQRRSSQEQRRKSSNSKKTTDSQPMVKPEEKLTSHSHPKRSSVNSTDSQ
jgi:hypothetical protein